MKRKKFKPNKNTHPVIWFDLQKGEWFGDCGMMRKMIAKGLQSEGIRFGKHLLGKTYSVAKAEIEASK